MQEENPPHYSGPLKLAQARSLFALDHLHQHDAEHLVHIPKPRPDGPRSLVLTPLELRDQIAAPVPPLRIHRHRYQEVLARMAACRKFSRQIRTAGHGRFRPKGLPA